MSKYLIIPLVVFGLLSSCSIQKRKHMKGYHVSRQHKVKYDVSANNPEKITDATSKVKDFHEETLVNLNKEQLLEASLETDYNSIKGLDAIAPTSVYDVDYQYVEGCDMIVMKNGDDISAKVIEITPTEIKYKKCDNLESGVLYTVFKKDVFFIKYSDGRKESFSSNETTVEEVRTSEKTSEKKLNILGLLGFISSFLFPLAGLILSYIALNQFKKYPDKYKDKWMAIAGFWISWTYIMIVLLTLLLLL